MGRGSFYSAKELWMCKLIPACVHSIDRDCLVGATNALSKKTKMEPVNAEGYTTWLRSGAEIATLPRRPPNQTTLPRAGRLSHLTFPKTSCIMPTKRLTAAIRRLQLDWAHHKPRRRLLLASHRRRRQPVGFSLVCFLSRRWIKPAITPAAFVQSGESGLPPW